jgi:hypothetical protein
VCVGGGVPKKKAITLLVTVFYCGILGICDIDSVGGGKMDIADAIICPCGVEITCHVSYKSDVFLASDDRGKCALDLDDIGRDGKSDKIHGIAIGKHHLSYKLKTISLLFKN